MVTVKSNRDVHTLTHITVTPDAIIGLGSEYYLLLGIEEPTTNHRP